MNPYLYGYRLIAALAALLFTTAAQAQSAQDFYKGKTFQFVVGYPPGGPHARSGDCRCPSLPCFTPRLAPSPAAAAPGAAPPCPSGNR